MSKHDCRIIVDGLAVSAVSGQSVAAALIAGDLWAFRRNPASGDLRGPYCGMGVCFECEVSIDGVPHRRACMTEIRPGMVIITASGNLHDGD